MTPIKQLRENDIDLVKVQNGEYDVMFEDKHVGYLYRERHNGEGKHGSKTPGYYTWNVALPGGTHTYYSFDEAKAGLLEILGELK